MLPILTPLLTVTQLSFYFQVIQVGKMAPASLPGSYPYAGSRLKHGRLFNSIQQWLGLPLVYPGCLESGGPCCPRWSSVGTWPPHVPGLVLTQEAWLGVATGESLPLWLRYVPEQNHPRWADGALLQKGSCSPGSWRSLDETSKTSTEAAILSTQETHLKDCFVSPWLYFRSSCYHFAWIIP